MIFFVGYDLILLLLIIIYATSVALFDNLLNSLSNNICYIISGVFILTTFVATILNTSAQNDKNKKSFSFWISLVTTILYIPYLLFTLESYAVDKSCYLISFIKTDSLEEQCMYCIIFTILMIIVPQLLSYIPNTFLNKLFNTLPILIGIIMTFYMWNTVADSYNNYLVEEYKNNQYMIETTVKENAEIYIASSEAPLTIYPFFSPVKLTNGTVIAGNKVNVVEDVKDWYKDYVLIVADDRAGYIRRELLKDEIAWRGY